MVFCGTLMIVSSNVELSSVCNGIDRDEYFVYSYAIPWVKKTSSPLPEINMYLLYLF